MIVAMLIGGRDHSTYKSYQQKGFGGTVSCTVA